VPVLHSYLRLGAGVTLEVLQILRQARAWQSSQRAEEAGSCGLVVLAACLSDVTDADYDEALTLATAFMSAGAGGVVAARWPVAENATALFMAMFHRYLNDGGLSPPMALQAAQLWMLDSGREVPDDLPAVLRDEAELAGEPDGPDLANPAAWAGFSYQGR
jgi:CHAT domain-containing protein